MILCCRHASRSVSSIRRSRDSTCSRSDACASIDTNVRSPSTTRAPTGSPACGLVVDRAIAARSSARPPVPSITTIRIRRSMARRTSSIVFDPPPARTATAGLAVDNSSRASNRSDVSPPHSSLLARMKLVWFGSSFVVPADRWCSSPSNVTLPAGATPRYGAEASLAATAWPSTAMTPDAVPPSMIVEPVSAAARTTPRSKSRSRRRSTAGSSDSAPPMTSRIGVGEGSSSASINALTDNRGPARTARATFPLSNVMANGLAPPPASGPMVPPAAGPWAESVAPRLSSRHLRRGLRPSPPRPRVRRSAPGPPRRARRSCWRVRADPSHPRALR